MKKFILFLSSLVLVACGGSDGGFSSPNNSIKTYTVNAYPYKEFSNICNPAHGELVLNGSNVSGTVKREDNDMIYVISGTYIQETGDIEGGFAINSRTIAVFDGKIVGNKGNGIWEDDLGCSGTWSANIK